MITTRALFRRFLHNDTGSTATLFAIAVPVFFAVGSAAIDYTFASRFRVKMQAAADSAALTSVRGLQLAQADTSSIAAVATNVINAVIDGATTTANVNTKAASVQVTVTKTYTPAFGQFFVSPFQLQTTATAKLSGSLPICLLALDRSSPDTIGLEKDALLTAPNCLVQSNSKNPSGIKSKNNAVMTAGMICSSGGKAQSGPGNFSPAPLTDCPTLPDPLASRPLPTVVGCDYTNKVVDGQTLTLYPGVYCGGLIITNGAIAQLTKGVFIIKDGPLIVDGGASVSGTEVGFFLTGNDSNLTFDSDSSVSLSAPKDGPLAGLLILDDPTGAPATAKAPKSGRGAQGRSQKNSAPRQHQILSDDARMMLGTIYMPQGEIIIDATKPIADKSAYTVLVVQQLRLYSGPNLVLNTDYGASEIPVPQGVGPYGTEAFLSN